MKNSNEIVLAHYSPEKLNFVAYKLFRSNQRKQQRKNGVECRSVETFYEGSEKD